MEVEGWVLESEPKVTVSVDGHGDGRRDAHADDWYLPQTVTLSAAYDGTTWTGRTITHTTSGGDYGANNVSTSVAAVEQDRMGASTKVTLSLSPDEVGEGDGQTGHGDGPSRR